MNETKKTIIFLQGSLSQPREIKRIRSFIDAGYNVKGYAFDRSFYNINSIVDDVNFFNIGYLKSGSNYLLKFLYTRRELKKIFKKYNTEGVYFYSFSFNHTLLCSIYSKNDYIYEISDIVYTYFNNKLIRILFKKIDQWLIKKSYLTVLTSAGFSEFLFSSNTPTNMIIQPNKVDAKFNYISDSCTRIVSNKLVFAFVGSFRYPNTIFRFARIIGEMFLNHEFYFFGDSEYTNDVIDIAKKYKNVFYMGPYRSPDDLFTIYSQIDIIVACYDTVKLNERIAEPNKFYEALFFKKPIIVSANTYLASQVRKYECGFELDASKDANIIELINNSLSITKLKMVINNIEKINKQEFIDDNGLNILNFINQ
jgi:succinoglycan biosynthesis protein ExoL